MLQKKFNLILLVLVLVAASVAGCESQEKKVFQTHQMLGALLISSQRSAENAHKEGIINDETYNNIKVNWLRARDVYVQANVIADQIVKNGGVKADFEAYFSMANVVRSITSDIISWVGEDRQ